MTVDIGDFNLGAETSVIFTSMTENNVECITVNTLTDLLVENLETLDLTLTGSTNLVVLQDQNTTQIKIIDANGMISCRNLANVYVQVTQKEVRGGGALPPGLAAGNFQVIFISRMHVRVCTIHTNYCERDTVFTQFLSLAKVCEY